MKSTYLLLLSFIILFLDLSCKKTEKQTIECTKINKEYTGSIDTIKPSDYLAAYPGSWWKYNKITQLTDTNETMITANSWKVFSTYSNFEHTPCDWTIEKKAVGVSTGWGIVNNSTIQGGDPNEMFGTHFHLSGVPGWTWDTTYRDSYRETIETSSFVKHLDTLTISGVLYHDIIHIHKKVQHQIFGKFYPKGPSYHHFHYLAKNIGIIRYIVTDPSGTYPIFQYDLKEHFIAPH